MNGRLTAAVLLLMGGAVAGCSSAGTDAAVRPAGSSASSSGPAERLVWVSGRDDHGMVAEESVPVYDAVEGHHVLGEVPDGTLARVLATDGQWLRVRTAEGNDRVTGWVDDFFLRGEVRLVGPAPSCRAPLGGRPRAGGTLVVVRDLRGGRARVETAARAHDRRAGSTVHSCRSCRRRATAAETSRPTTDTPADAAAPDAVRWAPCRSSQA